MKLALLALATAAQARLAPAPLRKPAALAVRGGGAVDPEFYRKFWATTGGIYGAQCLLAPKSMTEMHYEAKSSQMTEFWLRTLPVSHCPRGDRATDRVRRRHVGHAPHGVLPRAPRRY